VYIVQDSAEVPTEDDLARIIMRTFGDNDVYHTTTENGTTNLRTEKIYRDIWNLADPYGVFFSYGHANFFKTARKFRQATSNQTRVSTGHS
jgi:hypothetical protein